MKIKFGKIIKDAAKIAKAVDAAKKPAAGKKPAPAPKPAAKPVAKPKPAATPKPKAPAAPVVQPAPVIASPPPPATPATPPPVADDFAGVTDWHGKSRGTWPVTVQVSNVRVEGGDIVWEEPTGQREARNWNVIKGKKTVNGETNLIVPAVKAAGSFDYLGVGQTRKTFDNLIINQAKGKPGTFPPWSPKKGDRVGFYISTISRDKNHAKMQERSNVVWITWP